MPASGKRVIGILAHVDAGKTTLSEGLLYAAGNLRSKGRVDHGDSFLDTLPLEKQRGITIFSKIARLERDGEEILLLDTPGHADFSPEMERALSILDYAILVVSGADGVTPWVKRLWRLLAQYRLPVLLFVNKMDQPGAQRQALYALLRGELSDHIMDFGQEDAISCEDTATCSEALLDEYLEAGSLSEGSLFDAIAKREVFPCWFGSALRGDGVREFLEALYRWTMAPDYPEEFSARVFKISRDEEGRRLTELKVTGGSLKNRMALGEEKVTELRLYSGSAWTSVQEVQAGDICAAAGLSDTWAGQGLGREGDIQGSIQPLLSYRVNLEGGGDEGKLLKLLGQIGEELPELKVAFREDTQEIYVHIMGEVLLEVLADLILERGGMRISVDEGSIIYRESVAEPVIGIGHFEPPRHYAEVQLLLEPLGRDGEGEIVAESQVSEDYLPLPWQRAILNFLREQEHPGVLLGAPLSQIRVTLLAGRGHDRHTTGGDFRQAVARALRQGLMSAREKGIARVLEPMVEFEMITSTDVSGRVLSELSLLEAKSLTSASLEGGRTRIMGQGPVKTLRGYEREFRALTRGEGQLRLSFSGYAPCHDEARVVAEGGYNPEADVLNPAGSIFLAQGAGCHVPWQEVPQRAHIPPLDLDGEKRRAAEPPSRKTAPDSASLAPGEVTRILAAASLANVNEKKKWRKGLSPQKQTGGKSRTASIDPKAPVYLIVDGYNVIYAWPDLAALAVVNFDAARNKLEEILHDYQGYTGETILLVFDAYRVEGGTGSESTRDKFSVIFTREKQTADGYIEAKAMELAKSFMVKVVTSDAAEQRAAMGSGALVYSAQRFGEIVSEVRGKARQDYERDKEPEPRNRPFADLKQRFEGDE